MILVQTEIDPDYMGIPRIGGDDSRTNRRKNSAIRIPRTGGDDPYGKDVDEKE